MSRRLSVLVVVAILAPTIAFNMAAADGQQVEDWPRYESEWFFEIVKDPDASPAPFEPWDHQWLHLHRNHPSLPDAPVNTIAPRIYSGYSELAPSLLDVEVRYLVRDIDVSDWIGAPFRFALDIDNEGLGQLPDGVHGLTIEARGPDRLLIQPVPAFVHISRDLASGEPYGFTRSVPILNIMQGFPSASGAHAGPGIVYVDPDERVYDGFPANPSPGPWTTPPHETDLYQELMAPHSELFFAAQMWWDHPAHSNAPFIRGMTPQHGEDHRSLRVDSGHERFPMKDGPRGIGWMSPYVTGQIDSQGRFAFAEAGGRVGYLMPDGEVITIAGWRVQPDLDPIWWEKPTDVVRQNMEVRGTWTAGRGEFRTPLDVAVDPLDENILYVVGYEDHVIWRIDVPADPRTQQATVSILAGDPSHGSGFTDGSGSDARFNGPASLVFDPVADVLYVADQDNDAIRRVDRSGNVTTVAGQPGMQAQLVAGGVDWTDQLAARDATQFLVSEPQAAAGVVPDIFRPQAIRVDSHGRIVLLELGYGSIRSLDPTSLETELLGEVRQKHAEFDRGWAWLDVDRWGNSGPTDGIYWVKFVNTLPGEFTSEVYSWLPPDGGESFNIFPSPTGLYPDGWGRRSATNPPHYGWLVAVDPRGGILLAGGGEHGVTRLRAQRATDPIESTSDYWLGRTVYNSGAPVDAPVASQSLALRHGWNGHNYLGLTNAWSFEGASDDDLLDAFGVSDAIRNDPDARRQLLAFIRPNTIGAATAPPPPTPTSTPTPTTVFCNGLAATIDMNSNGGNGTGTLAADVILGTTGADVIVGLGGNDTICGGDGDDTIVGGDGDDTLFGESGRDILRGNAGLDVVDGGAGDDRLLGGIDGDDIRGGSGDDFIGGFGGADIITGGPGRDTIFGGFGADTISGDGGADIIFGLIGDDIINGGDGPDFLQGDRGRDTIFGDGGDDVINGGNGNDILHGNLGDDSVNGGRADDTLSGGGGVNDACSGNKHLVGDTADDTCELIFGVP